MFHADGLDPHLSQVVVSVLHLEALSVNPTTLLNCHIVLDIKTLNVCKEETSMKSYYAHLQTRIRFHIEVFLIDYNAVANIIGIHGVFTFHHALHLVTT